MKIAVGHASAEGADVVFAASKPPKPEPQMTKLFSKLAALLTAALLTACGVEDSSVVTNEQPDETSAPAEDVGTTEEALTTGYVWRRNSTVAASGKSCAATAIAASYLYPDYSRLYSCIGPRNRFAACSAYGHFAWNASDPNMILRCLP